jgi:transposase
MDDKTICNFRTDNERALRATFREFNLMCRGLELYRGETVAVDETKIWADNSRKNNHNHRPLNRRVPNCTHGGVRERLLS